MTTRRILLNVRFTFAGTALVIGLCGAIVSASTRAPAVTKLMPEVQRQFDGGRAIFEMTCAACHGLDGQGREKLGANLVSSKYVQAAPAVLVRIITNGKQGSVGVMPALMGQFSDDQIADVLTYIRHAWGHTASAVTSIQVRRSRESIVHTGPWTDEELSAMLATGRGRRAGGQRLQ